MEFYWDRMRWPRYAGRSLPEAESRDVANVALVDSAVTLALTLNVHFYGVFLLIPVCAAEICERTGVDVRIKECSPRLPWGWLRLPQRSLTSRCRPS